MPTGVRSPTLPLAPVRPVSRDVGGVETGPLWVGHREGRDDCLPSFDSGARAHRSQEPRNVTGTGTDVGGGPTRGSDRRDVVSGKYFSLGVGSPLVYSHSPLPRRTLCATRVPRTEPVRQVDTLPEPERRKPRPATPIP